MENAFPAPRRRDVTVGTRMSVTEAVLIG